MRFREGTKFPPVHLNIISNWGGLGDSLARIPAIKWGLEQYEHVAMTVYWPDYFYDLAKFLFNHERLEHQKLSRAPYTLKEPIIEFDPNRVTSLGIHLTQQAFLLMYDRVAKPEWMKYCKAPFVDLYGFPDQLEDKNLITFTTAATAPIREWPAYEVNQLAESARERGLTPVLLGSTDVVVTGDKHNIQGVMDDGIDRSLFLDLTNRTSLIEALGVMQRSKAVVGVDNGLLHLACYTNKPVVIGYTSVEAEIRVPFREEGQTEVVEALVPEYGFQSNWNFVNHDFMRCPYEDYACTLTMTAKRFEEKLLALNIY